MKKNKIFEKEHGPLPQDQIEKMDIYKKGMEIIKHVDNIKIIVQNVVKENEKTTAVHLLLDVDVDFPFDPSYFFRITETLRSIF